MVEAKFGSVQRLFFALWPDVELQTHIFNGAEALTTASAHSQPLENLHLTLLFLGQVNTEQQACLEQAANALTLSRFELKFGELVHRGKQDMLWLQPKASDDGNVSLARLVTCLCQQATDCGLSIDLRPFRAHMTLQRKWLPVAENMSFENYIQDFIWPVQEFSLLASKTLATGAEYQLIKKWNLS